MVCDIVAGLPGTELDPPGGDNPAWRVKDVVVVRRNPRLRVPDEEAIRQARGELVSVRVDPSERKALLQEDPGTFFITPHWEASPSVLVWLTTVDPAELRELLVDAWRLVAPKQLVREWDAANSDPA